ncbi:hypothetical protein ELQ92_01260 [Labedella populi]|uniref:Uncharacterized protein n=1 Tax=Labedella populi TaxID=2498850 RepID=A0A444QEC5_9MICO|nr:hypothetical protein [Labedella populi]RWZ67923.1 hypothetical protein ELQ92_01260 [Labedella populi]
MEAILLPAAVLLIVIVGIVLLPLVGRRQPPVHPEEQRRAGAGVGVDTDIGAATDRATGTTAWMRPGGGGV